MNVQTLANQVIFEDNHLLIVNKFPKQIVQGDKTGDISLLEHLREYIRVSANKPGKAFIGLTHRLDRPCSGVVVYVKTSKALERMNRIFREGKVSKKYLAVTENEPPVLSETLRHFLKKNEKQNKSYISDENSNESKEAILKYRLVQKSDRYSLLEIDLVTGRHHQIRAQLSHMGCPIRGDLKYGAARSNRDGSIHLHALSIAFIHPVRNELMKFTAMPPEEDSLWSFFFKNFTLCGNDGHVITQNKAGCTEIIGINEVPGE